jgi:diguanylate cyclase (GGDEF)-like protein/PAS domain S-box-containing protein
METNYKELLLGMDRRPKILVVDDQAMNIRLVSELFKSDCDIYMAMDGEQAIAQCIANLPDLVLLDLVMPGMDGYEVCRRLKADVRTQHIPIIFITSQHDEADEALGFEMGAVDYVTKPFNHTVLVAMVRNHLVLKLQADLLQASERFMRTLTDSIPASIAYWNTDQRCLFANARYQQYFGKTPAQMVGIPMRELLGEALFDKNDAAIHAALRGVPQRFERTLNKADGSATFVLIQYVPDVHDGRVLGFFVLASDVSELKRAQLAAIESAQFAESTINTVPETICVLDKTGVIIGVNQAWRDFYDVNSDDPQARNYALGTNYLQLCKSAIGVGAAEAPLMAEGLAAVLAGERDLFSLEYPCDSPTEKRFFFVQVKRYLGESGHVLVAHGNITERKLLELELANIAQTDVLTGLNTRRHFMQLSEIELSRTSRYGGALSVIMLDIDHFKRINDTHGHQVGDTAIQLLAAVCKEQLRDLDVIGRLGGEEFAVTMPNANDAQAMVVAERLRVAIEAASVPILRGEPLHFTVSIGVTTLKNDLHNGAINLGTLLDQADKALYDAKHGGRNQVCRFREPG